MTATYSADRLASILGLPRPTEEQTAVIEAPFGPALVVAGAGSGKTETMSARVVWLVANRIVAPQEVLGLTFTRKAAGELSERVRSRLARLRMAGVIPGPGQGITGPDQAAADDFDGFGRPTVSTYHSYAAGIVRDHGLRIGVEPDSRLLSQAGRWQIASDILEAWDGQTPGAWGSGWIVGALLQLADEIVENGLDPAEARLEMEAIAADLGSKESEGRRRATPPKAVSAIRSLQGRAAIMELVQTFIETKQRLGVLDYADLVALAGRIVDSASEIGAGERARYRAVLLDEYQDTSAGQIRLLASLFGQGHPVMAVGDPHQSIYAWRGASARGLSRFPDDFRCREGLAAPVLALSVAWRNDQAILDAANRIAAPLRALAPITLPILRPRPAVGPGHVASAYFETVEDEATAIANYLAEHYRDAPPVGSRPRTAAIVCRKRRQFGAIVEALSEAEIPYDVVGLGGLLIAPEVADILAALRAAHDPSRGDALMRLATSPRFRLGISDLAVLAAWARRLDRLGRLPARTAEPDQPETSPGLPVRSSGQSDEQSDVGSDVRSGGQSDVRSDVRSDVGSDGRSGGPSDDRPGEAASIVDALADLPPQGWVDERGRGLSQVGQVRLAGLGQILDDLRSLSSRSLPELILAAERRLGIDIDLMARGGSGQARARVDELVSIAASFAADAAVGSGGLGAFLDWTDAAIEFDNGLEPADVEPNSQAVQILTVHAAKGLEWDIVVVPGLVRSNFPNVDYTRNGEPDSAAWMSDLTALPWPMRRDAADLPILAHAEAASVVDLDDAISLFRTAAGMYAMAEERRIAYVAMTRARQRLVLTGSWWRDASKPAPPSVFLDELRQDGLAGDPFAVDHTADDRMAVDQTAVDQTAGDQTAGDQTAGDQTAGDQTAGDQTANDQFWADPPADSAANPRSMAVRTAIWPVPNPLGARRDMIKRAAAQIQTAAAQIHSDAALTQSGTTHTQADAALTQSGTTHTQAAALGLVCQHDARAAFETLAGIDSPDARRAELFMAESHQRNEIPAVQAPAHLTTSDIVRLSRDPDTFALDLRRPVPREPSPAARRGVAFHAWVEQHFGLPSMLDDDAAFAGSDDEPAARAADFDRLREAFEASQWADPAAHGLRVVGTEVDIESSLGSMPVRSRIDAVFQDRATGDYIIVDWKTGREPSTAADAAARRLQLVVYREVFARFHGIETSQVRAAFHYVLPNRTVWLEQTATADALPKLSNLGEPR